MCSLTSLERFINILIRRYYTKKEWWMVDKQFIITVILVLVVAMVFSSVNSVTGKATVAQCNDGIDNDGDTFIDYPDDPGCNKPGDNNEHNHKIACDDGKDNDNDSLIDYPKDPGCSSPLDKDEKDVITECNDLKDNDGDGFIDLSDPGCTSSSDTSEHGTNECDDGIDNFDADNLGDLKDDGCTGLKDTSEISGQCDDGLDNDGDGFIDYGNGTNSTSDPECNSYKDIETDCSDTDGGKVYDVKGIVSGNYGGTPFSDTDLCPGGDTSGGKILQEFFCNFNTGKSQNQLIDCSTAGNSTNNWTKCENGRCVP